MHVHVPSVFHWYRQETKDEIGILADFVSAALIKRELSTIYSQKD